jgi:guanylate kinase
MRDSTFPIVLAGPSGSGKTTLVREILDRRGDLRFSVSVTSRKPRAGENSGVHYTFLERAEFDKRCSRGELLEWAEVHGDLYGTPLANLEAARADGVHLLLDIDVQGARAVREAVPEAVTVFLLPPAGAWLSRLRQRGSESRETLQRRLRSAATELDAADDFQYVVVNDDLEQTVRRVEAILEAEESRTARVGIDLVRLVSALEEEISAAQRDAAGEELDDA